MSIYCTKLYSIIHKKTKKKLKKKDIGMARQKVCKQGRDDIKVKVEYIMPYPYIFCSSTAQDM